MIYVVAFALAVVAVVLTWLVVTQKLVFPILFEVGLAILGLGAVAAADTLVRGELFSMSGAGITLLGIALLLASYCREKKKRNTVMRHGAPREIDGRHMGNITGGKHESH